jgi:hypothetical protein
LACLLAEMTAIDGAMELTQAQYSSTVSAPAVPASARSARQCTRAPPASALTKLAVVDSACLRDNIMAETDRVCTRQADCMHRTNMRADRVP